MAKKLGFAAMTPERRRAVSSKGGQSAHRQGVAHQWTSAEASAAGKIGGTISKRRPTASLPAAQPAIDDVEWPK